jgi:sugar O-acyltransferase (sialic acid O-acetyltransferase NeuD family)
MPDRLVVFGSGGHAKVVIEAALARAPAREIVILDDADEAKGHSIFGNMVLGGRAELDSLKGVPVVPAIGNNEARAQLLAWLRDQDHALETIIHPSATVASSADVGDGVFVSAGAVVIAEARIGDGAIVNTAASVDHDCVIGEAAHIGPGVHLCGNVRIGARTLVGVGSSVSPGISVCDDVVVGAGSVVVRDIEEAGTYAGNPARRLR